MQGIKVEVLEFHRQRLPNSIASCLAYVTVTKILH